MRDPSRLRRPDAGGSNPLVRSAGTRCAPGRCHASAERRGAGGAAVVEGLLDDADGAVIVAVAAVGMMEVVLDQVVDVVPVGHGLVTAPRAVLVIGVVAGAAVVRRAVGRVVGVHPEGVLVHVVGVHVMEVSIVQVVDVILVLDRGVATVGTVNVRVLVVLGTGHRLLRG
jgi:hypothetical protein